MQRRSKSRVAWRRTPNGRLVYAPHHKEANSVASAQAGWVNGQGIQVDGGYIAALVVGSGR
jgi:hypothetical protein